MNPNIMTVTTLLGQRPPEQTMSKVLYLSFGLQPQTIPNRNVNWVKDSLNQTQVEDSSQTASEREYRHNHNHDGRVKFNKIL